MRNCQTSFSITAALLLAAALSGCGGGGGDSGGTPGPSAEGNYGGTLSGSVSTGFQLLVLETGEFCSIYGTSTNTSFLVRGVVQGTGTSNNGAFTSSNVRDFGISPVPTGSVTATYDAVVKTVSGSMSFPAGAVTFSGGPVPGSLYNYNVAPSPTLIVGAWTLGSTSGNTITMTVAANGAFTARDQVGCNFTGTIVPRPSGKNVFNVTMTFGVAPCSLPGQTVTGIALAYPLANGTTQLMVSAIDNARTLGSVAFGIR